MTKTPEEIIADPFLWLEDVDSSRSKAWVSEQNRISQSRLTADPQFEAYVADALSVYEAPDKIAYALLRGTYVYNFWQDRDHIRGLWRRASYDSYRAGTPDWQTLLDIDALAKAENENWVYKGHVALSPDMPRVLISLSRGGLDATTYREFDVETRNFVDGGFVSPEAKQYVAWADADTLLIATDFGADTMNASGYPRQVRRWRRGTALVDAEPVLDSDPAIVFNFPFAAHGPAGSTLGVLQGPDFFSQTLYLLNTDGKLQKAPLPKDIDIKGVLKDQLILTLRKDWSPANSVVLRAGAIVALPVSDLLKNTVDPSQMAVCYPSSPAAVFESVDVGAERLFITELADVTATLYTLTPDRHAEGFKRIKLDIPTGGAVHPISADSHSDRASFSYQNFLTPDTLYAVDGLDVVAVQALTPHFSADDLTVSQRYALSEDGTRIPYFLIHRKDMPADGTTPTMLYGYGGFEISLSPTYLTGFARLWVKAGGAYATANIRGGGEYGPAWHQAALRENRQRAYDDFIAVAEDLIASGITTPKRLGIRGGSNGGLLMGAMLTQRPDLFGAIICAVPLLDMQRYHRLLAGASWVGEYGDPGTDDWQFIKSYSPYHNLDSTATYPEVFFYTSTKDDRVHPGHARKMAAKMQAMGHACLYYEITDGGHAAAADQKAQAYVDGLQMAYARALLLAVS